MFSTQQIKAFRTSKTPFFFYDLELLEKTIREIKKHGVSKGYHIHFAMKANFNDRILKIMLDSGFGVDCVSGKEIEKAIETGFKPNQIAFAGVGKTDEEIETGLKYDIFSFNCESLQEIGVLNDLAGRQNKKARIALRLNPNVEAKTHKYITTGLQENKFGIPSYDLPELFDLIPASRNINLTGIHFHIGSQILDLSTFRNLCNRINKIHDEFKKRGFLLKHINVGGGLGIDYSNPDKNAIPDFKTYFELFSDHLNLENGQELHFELGRSIIGQCGSLISKVLYTKKGNTTNFAILDAGMTELIRPALYQAQHHIDVLTSNEPAVTYDVVGPICETSDTFRAGIKLPRIERCDLVAIRSCG
ncbi:MAG: diaminopimelate decarboxylase, partial [Balneolaceae bacterium]